MLKAVFEAIRIAYESRKQPKFLRQTKMDLKDILLLIRKIVLWFVISI